MDKAGAERRDGESGRPAGGEPTQYVCTECRRTFTIPPGAPKQTDDPEIDGLWCPWCTRWAVPVGSELPTARGSTRTRRSVTWAMAIVGVGLLGVLGYLAWAERDDEGDDPGVLASALKETTVSLEQGLELGLPPGVPVDRFDFEQKGLEGWRSVDGQWGIEEMGGAPSGKRVLVQRAARNAFNVIVAPGGPYTDVDVSVRFKPISGREDASGGIVFRFSEGRYYVLRANALENNFRLYYYDRGRRQLASVTVEPPTLGQWHTLRVVAVGDRIQGYLNGKLLLDHRDTRFRSGQVGLWTKADSVTAFDDLVIRGVGAGG